MNIAKQLETIGLNNSEISVYLYLLENGLSTAAQIGKGAKVGRTNSYHIVRGLQEKGFAHEQIQRGKKYYIASDPNSLLVDLDKKKTAIAEILPDLRSLYTVQKNKPKIKFYDGWEQVKGIYNQCLGSEIIYALGSTRELTTRDESFFTDFISKLKANGTIVKDILYSASGEKTLENIKGILKGLYDVKVLPEKYEDIQTDILIWEDNIALVVLSEPIFGTVLTNKLMATSFKVFHEVAWESL